MNQLVIGPEALRDSLFVCDRPQEKNSGEE